ncbi:MAG TPA: hypothetical protein VGX28_06540 [Frankiaceae bacterium]|jgi:hypothetical protein|nr:hypothetical protein [Frankiaceae bacterium]
MKRTLRLRREALAPLATADLAAVNGAAYDATPSCPVQSGIECPTSPLARCVTDLLSDRVVVCV